MKIGWLWLNQPSDQLTGSKSGCARIRVDPDGGTRIPWLSKRHRLQAYKRPLFQIFSVSFSFYFFYFLKFRERESRLSLSWRIPASLGRRRLRRRCPVCFRRESGIDRQIGTPWFQICPSWGLDQNAFSRIWKKAFYRRVNDVVLRRRSACWPIKPTRIRAWTRRSGLTSLPVDHPRGAIVAFDPLALIRTIRSDYSDSD